MILVLGAGIAGLSASYHIGHKKCLLLESQDRPYGHIGNVQRDGFTWDQGPHVSFTKNEYVKKLFDKSVGGQYQELSAKVSNYYQGNWIAHPAQTALYQIPEPLRSSCLESFLKIRSEGAAADIKNYQNWLDYAFGPVFSKVFASVYTEKYWTLPPSELTTEWVGDRILFPSIQDVTSGAKRMHERSMHYISEMRYPTYGGFSSFAKVLEAGANICYGAEVISIDLLNKIVYLMSGEKIAYKKLVNTLPLPIFMNALINVPTSVLDATRNLTCTQAVLVNVAAPHTSARNEHWAYVYDEKMLTTRINCIEKLSPNNAPEGWTGIQAEVYFSRHKPLSISPSLVGEQVERELIKIGFLNPERYGSGQASHRHIKYVPWANVVFQRNTAASLEKIWTWLEGFGLKRELDDLHPLTNWNESEVHAPIEGSIFMAGRFGQWKYYWTDDCVLRGKFIADVLRD
jgi:protoporphyrinogen oxidase